MATPLVPFMQGLRPDSPAAQIANMHTLFNVGTTLLLLPLGSSLVKLAMVVMPDSPEEKEDGMCLQYLSAGLTNTQKDHLIGSSAMYLTQLREELERMLDMARENVSVAFQAVLERDPRKLEGAERTEDYIDFLNGEISRSITQAMVRETNERDSTAIGGYFKITGNIERIGDHAMNICGYSRELETRGIRFSGEAREELETMEAVSKEILTLLRAEDLAARTILERISVLEQKMDDMTEAYRDNEMLRIKEGICADEGCIIYSQILTDFERIGDHALNIAQERAAIESQGEQAG